MTTAHKQKTRRMPKTSRPRRPDYLSQLAVHQVEVPKPDQVKPYLAEHPKLASFLPEICADVREEFGLDAELSLELYIDPEIDDRYLTLEVRLREYNCDVMRRIETISERFFDSLAPLSGHFLLTTDHRQPKGNHAV